MTDLPHDPRPFEGLSPEDLDELLSALLDGELGAAADDVGLDREALRAHLEAKHADRGAALAAARGLLAEPPAPLDPLTRRRLVGIALSTGSLPSPAPARRERRRLVLPAAAGIAAAVLLVVAAAAVITTLSRGGNEATMKASGEAANEAERAPGGAGARALDLGEVSDPEALRRKLARRLDDRPGPATTIANRPASPAPPAAGSARDDSGANEFVDKQGSPATSISAPADRYADCPTLLAEQLAVDGPPILTATATYEGEPAGVLAFSTDGGTLAVVYRPADCTLLASQWSAP